MNDPSRIRSWWSRPQTLAWISGAVGLVLAVFLLVRHILSDPSLVLLAPLRGTEWILESYDYPLAMITPAPTHALFRRTFNVDESFKSRTFHFKAFRRAEVFLDGSPVRPDAAPVRNCNRSGVS